jgi:uncharacterized membrane protein
MARFEPLSRLHKAWFGAVVALGVIYVFVLPPFQGNDEWPHWVRSWTIAQGDVKCGDIPRRAFQANGDFSFSHERGDAGRVRFDNFRQFLTRAPDAGAASAYKTSACAYWPLSYVVPAIVLRVIARPSQGVYTSGRLLLGFYAVRLSGWVIMCGFVLWAVLALPWARNLLLYFVSIPEVVQQSSVLNNDLVLFVLTLLMLVCLARPPTWRRVAGMCAAIFLMTMTKPVFIVLAPLVALPLLELRAGAASAGTAGGRRFDWRHVLVLVVLVPLPILLRKAWTAYVHFDEIVWLPPWNVHPDQQVAFLKQHPLHLFTILIAQVRDTFRHGLMQGSWTSILGALGSSELEMAPIGYALCLLSCAAAVAADLLRGIVPEDNAPRTRTSRARRWAVALAVLGIGSIFPAVVLAMYLLFSSVGADSVNGVQGRYYLVPLLLFAMLALAAAQRRFAARLARPRWSHVIAALAGAASIASLWCAVRAVAAYYWAL